MNDDSITHVKREFVYVEGELSFNEGRWRRDNPYSSSSPTLQQVWWNGWDHGRRIKQKERSTLANHAVWPSRANTGAKTIPEVILPLKRMLAYAEGRKAFEEKRWRAFNPYKDIHEELASDWLSGWDQAEEESKGKSTGATQLGGRP
jgi:ribosome modulation factor